MTDVRLRTYLQALEQAHITALKEARNEEGQHAWVDMTWPSVVLVLPGMLVSGQVVSHLGYIRRMRANIGSAPFQGEGSAEKWRGVLSSFFADPSEDIIEDMQEDLIFKQIHLINVSILMAHQTVHIGQTAIELSSINGWTFGQLDE